MANYIESDDIDELLIAVDAFRRILENAGQNAPLPFEASLLLKAMDDPSPRVRREAIRIAVGLDREDVPALVATHHTDEDAGVRKAASAYLKQTWTRSRKVLVPILESMDGTVIDSVLDSIPPGEPEIQDTLRRFIHGEMSNIHHLRALIAPLPDPGGRA